MTNRWMTEDYMEKLGTEALLENIELNIDDLEAKLEKLKEHRDALGERIKIQDLDPLIKLKSSGIDDDFSKRAHAWDIKDD